MMPRMYYILDEENQPMPVTIEDYHEWRVKEGDNFNSRLRVGLYEYHEDDWEVTISTVFLGLDHAAMSAGPPELFETLVSVLSHGEPIHNQDIFRYPTWDSAEESHNEIVERICMTYGFPVPTLADELPDGGASAIKSLSPILDNIS